jgi:hypothetical protein
MLPILAATTQDQQLDGCLTHGITRIRAHVELGGDQLHVHANSEARFQRVLAMIGELDPTRRRRC